jgi:hypothetical protein
MFKYKNTDSEKIRNGEKRRIATPTGNKPVPRSDDVETLRRMREQAELAAEYGHYLVEIRMKTIEALDPALRTRLFQLKSEKSWGTRELLNALIREYHTVIEQLKDRDKDPAYPSVRSLLSIGSDQKGEDDPYVRALRDKEQELDKAWQSHTAELGQKHKLAIEQKNKELKQLEKELSRLSSKIEMLGNHHKDDLEELALRHKNHLTAELDSLQASWVSHMDIMKEKENAAIRAKDEELTSIKSKFEQKLKSAIEDRDHQVDLLTIEKQSAAEAHAKALSEKQTMHQGEIWKLDVKHTETIQKLQYEITELHDQRAAWQVTGEGMRAAELDDQRTRFEEEISSLHKTHDGVLQHLNKEIADQKIQFEQQILQFHKHHDSVLQELKHEYEDQQNQLQTEFDKERDMLDTAIEKLRKQREADIEELQLSRTLEAAKINDEHENEVNRLKAERDDIAKTIQQELDGAIRGYKQDISSLNTILFARDQFTPVPDQVLGKKFSSLVHDVQNLARQTWELDQPVWSDSAIGAVTKNPSRLREQLLQDSIWR